MISPECNICQDEIYPIHVIKITPCCHTYHLICFNKWSLQRPPNTQTITICPTCRYDVIINIDPIDIKRDILLPVPWYINRRTAYRATVRSWILMTVCCLLFFGSLVSITHVIINKNN